jgi:hypothetical protein
VRFELIPIVVVVASAVAKLTWYTPLAIPFEDVIVPVRFENVRPASCDAIAVCDPVPDIENSTFSTLFELVTVVAVLSKNIPRVVVPPPVDVILRSLTRTLLPVNENIFRSFVALFIIVFPGPWPIMAIFLEVEILDVIV